MVLCCRVIHLDLKSSNVLIAADGTAKIADVGLSAQLQGHSHLSSMTVAGTWAWVAPEVIMAGAVTCAHMPWDTWNLYQREDPGSAFAASHGDVEEFPDETHGPDNLCPMQCVFP